MLADRRRFKFDLTWPVLFAFAALLCVLIVLPMSWLVYYSLTVDKRRSPFTLDQFRTLFSDPEFLDPLITTLHPRDVARASPAASSPRRWAGWWRAPTCR